MNRACAAPDGQPDLAGFDYRPGFLPRACADALLQRLWRELDWRQDHIVLFGRRVPQPRLSCWIGDPDAAYRYSGLSLSPAPWHPELSRLRKRLERTLGRPFNSVLANAYRDGRDSMGWHADDEPELGLEPMIASLSLGACRRFLVRRVDGGPTTAVELQHGSLLVMAGAAQASYRHAVPKTARPTGMRINLTFRSIRTQA